MCRSILVISVNGYDLTCFSLSDLDSTRRRLNSTSEIISMLRADEYIAFNHSANAAQVSMENLPRIAYQMEYFQLEMMFLSLQAPIMIPASVHIRRFKKYGKTYYPTPEGITLEPRWIEYIMRKKKVPESLRNYQVDFSLLNDTFK
ncbi:hypothetical protein TNCV_891551 [Trichonephila clavipes]|nr:hypothetical protein TNCV_891551 [Trichonephila clavipes]